MVDLDKVLGIVLDDFFATLQKIRKMISKNKYFKDYDFYTSHFKVIFNKFKTIKIDFLIQVQDCFEILKKIYFAESEICNEYLDGMYQLTKIYFQRVIKTLKQSTYYILNTINTKKSLFNDDFVKIQNIINIEINNLTIFYNNENENIIQNIVTFLREDFFNDDIYEMKRKIIKPEPIVYCTYNFNLFLFNSIIIKNKEYTDKLSEKLTDKKNCIVKYINYYIDSFNDKKLCMLVQNFFISCSHLIELLYVIEKHHIEQIKLLSKLIFYEKFINGLEKQYSMKLISLIKQEQIAKPFLIKILQDDISNIQKFQNHNFMNNCCEKNNLTEKILTPFTYMLRLKNSIEIIDKNLCGNLVEYLENLNLLNDYFDCEKYIGKPNFETICL
ncbi:hypothetical protein GVAV_002100 [Gurleya vavrai]